MEDLSYDLLTILQSKLQGVSAYDRYIADARAAGDEVCQSLFQRIKQQDAEQVEHLRLTIERLVKANKFK